MGIIEVLILAVGLSMDAFAVSVCKGLAMCKIKLKNACIVGLWFGAFQAGMPLIGYFLGASFQSLIEKFDHWVALVLLCLIGLNMIREAVFGGDEKCDCSVRAKDMVAPAFATSIDALIVGIAMAMARDNGEGGLNVFISVGIIGAVTFLLCVIGVKIGSIFGAKYKKAAEITGGVILILIGVKTVLEHLNVINF